MSSERFAEAALTLDVHLEPEAVRVCWLGRSTAREPGPFIVSVIGKALERAAASAVPLVLDFQGIDYMNSSTITPVIRLLNRARQAEQSVQVLYARSLKWQTLSFTALSMFQTADGRIEIRGV